MLIDWFTVVAQIINFLILVWLLKHFLYDRVIQAMDAREEKVRARLESAEEKEKESENAAEDYRRKNQEIDKKRKEMLDRAKKEAENQRKELIRQAREDVDHLRSKWEESVQQEKASFLLQLKQLAGQQVVAVSRRALKDLADAELEEQCIAVFLNRLKKMNQEKRNQIIQALQGNGRQAVVRSGFEISSSDRQKITKALHDYLSKEVEVQYETDAAMIAGVEIKSSGQKLTWSIGSYLGDLEARAREALEKRGAGSREQGAAKERGEGDRSIK